MSSSTVSTNSTANSSANSSANAVPLSKNESASKNTQQTLNNAAFDSKWNVWKYTTLRICLVILFTIIIVFILYRIIRLQQQNFLIDHPSQQKKRWRRTPLSSTRNVPAQSQLQSSSVQSKSKNLSLKDKNNSLPLQSQSTTKKIDRSDTKQNQAKFSAFSLFKKDLANNNNANTSFVITNESETPSNATSIFFSPKPNENVLQIFVGIGLNYSGENQLLTCWNDLRKSYNWWTTNIAKDNRTQNVFVMTDNPQPFVCAPTHPNLTSQVLDGTLSSWSRIRKQIVTLAKQQDQNGGVTEIMLHFSGHGFKRRTWDISEIDGQKESIVLVDGLYWDHEFAQDVGKQLPKSTHMLASFDSCHSGTVTNGRWTWNYISQQPNQTHTNSFVASIWTISGCGDFETSNSGATDRDESVLTRVMFTIPQAKILKNIESGPTPSPRFVDLYTELRSNLRLLKEAQIPEFSCSHVNLFSTPFYD
jgi:Caspase domain